MRTIERRAFAATELRAVRGEGGKLPTITGHAAVFNQDSEEFCGMIERVAPGAFAKAIGRDDVRALWNHDPNFVLGRNRAKTLRLAEDETGLAVEIDPPDAGWARDLVTSIERGDVSQMSFGFLTITDDWSTVGGKMLRVLKEVELFDVSPVTYPAYPTTDVAVRSAMSALAEEGRRRLAEAAPLAPLPDARAALRRRALMLRGS